MQHDIKKDYRCFLKEVANAQVIVQFAADSVHGLQQWKTPFH